MPRPRETGLAWLRRNLAWSNSRQSWEERLGGLVLLIGATVLAWYGGRLALSHQVLLWSLLVVVLAVLLRRGWLKLFGPVLFYDLVRLSRRGRYFVLRSLYALFLAALLCWVYLLQLLEGDQSGTVPASDMAQFAATFFYWFVAIQFVTVVILTPAYTAGAVAEEK